MKSKIPCPPAFIPVIRFDHATGLCGGMLVVNFRNDPCSASRAKFGILPSAMNFMSRSGSRPSIPRMIIFFEAKAPPRACWQETSRLKPAALRTSRHTNQKRFLKGAVTAIKCPASWLRTDGDRDITRDGNPRDEEQLSRLYAVPARRQRFRAVAPRGAAALIIILLMNGGAAFTLIVMVRIVMIRKVFIGLSLLFLSVSFASAASKPNLVLITLDSTRVDRMGFLGAKGASTPNLDRLASESLVFDHAYAQSPGAVVSHATILSGAYPQSTGMSEIGGTLPSALLYLPDLLKSQSYQT